MKALARTGILVAVAVVAGGVWWLANNNIRFMDGLAVPTQPAATSTGVSTTKAAVQPTRKVAPQQQTRETAAPATSEVPTTKAAQSTKPEPSSIAPSSLPASSPSVVITTEAPTPEPTTPSVATSTPSSPQP